MGSTGQRIYVGLQGTVALVADDSSLFQQTILHETGKYPHYEQSSVDLSNLGVRQAERTIRLTSLISEIFEHVPN